MPSADASILSEEAVRVLSQLATPAEQLAAVTFIVQRIKESGECTEPIVIPGRFRPIGRIVWEREKSADELRVARDELRDVRPDSTTPAGSLRTILRSRDERAVRSFIGE